VKPPEKPDARPRVLCGHCHWWRWHKRREEHICRRRGSPYLGVWTLAHETCGQGRYIGPPARAEGKGAKHGT